MSKTRRAGLRFFFRCKDIEFCQYSERVFSQPRKERKYSNATRRNVICAAVRSRLAAKNVGTTPSHALCVGSRELQLLVNLNFPLLSRNSPSKRTRRAEFWDMANRNILLIVVSQFNSELIQQRRITQTDFVTDLYTYSRRHTHGETMVFLIYSHLSERIFIQIPLIVEFWSEGRTGTCSVPVVVHIQTNTHTHTITVCYGAKKQIATNRKRREKQTVRRPWSISGKKAPRSRPQPD